MRKNQYLLVVLFVIIAMAGFISWAYMFSMDRDKKPKPVEKEIISEKGLIPQKKVENPAPVFSLKDINGKDISLSDFKGKVLVMNFWATWCPPCRAEIPSFIELYSEYKSRGLEVVGISLDWNGARVLRPFVDENEINYTVLLGTEDVSDRYGIVSIPTTYVIGRDGGIKAKHIGYREKEELKTDIEGLL